MIRLLRICAVLSLAVIPAVAQQAVDSTLRVIESLYNSAQYLPAELEARRLSEEQTLSDSAKLQVDTWIAFSLIAQGKSNSAREKFVAMLLAHPDLELDPILTSPKILAVFNDAKAKALARRKLNPESSSELTAQNSPQSITYRAIVFPGWEQLYRGETTAGTLFMSAGVASLGSGIVLEILRSKARNDYLSATSASDIASRYTTYNNYRKAEAYSLIAFAVVYIASEIDVFGHSETTSLTILPSSGQKANSSLRLSISF